MEFQYSIVDHIEKKDTLLKKLILITRIPVLLNKFFLIKPR